MRTIRTEDRDDDDDDADEDARRPRRRHHHNLYYDSLDEAAMIARAIIAHTDTERLR